MEYLFALQLLCGGFAAFVAARKGRSALAWFAVGILLPVVGVAMALWVGRKRERKAGSLRPAAEAAEKRPPKRCCGAYIADCQGCPFFTKPLFDPAYAGTRKGRCERFGCELHEDTTNKGGRVIVEE